MRKKGINGCHKKVVIEGTVDIYKDVAETGTFMF